MLSVKQPRPDVPAHEYHLLVNVLQSGQYNNPMKKRKKNTSKQGMTQFVRQPLHVLALLYHSIEPLLFVVVVGPSGL